MSRRSESLSVEIGGTGDWGSPALSLLAVFWALCVVIVLISGFFQKEFFNPEIAIPFLGVIAAGEFFYSLVLLNYERWRQSSVLWWALFLSNIVLITLILVSVHWNQSMFFMMYLINILAAGLTLKSRGGYVVGLTSLLAFNFAVVLSPQTRLISYLFTLVVNNTALLVVSYLAGELSDYLDSLGIKLNLAARSFREIRNLQEVILANIPSGILTVDSQGHLVQSNDRVREILTPSALAESERWPEFYRMLQMTEGQKMGRMEFHWDIGTESRRFIRCQQAPISVDQETESGTVYVIEDMTEVRAIEEVLRNQEKLAAIGKLAAGIAHEIRNPLASISGSVQLLSSQAGTEEDKKLFNIVIRETDRLNLLISEFLDYAKPLPKPTERMSLTSLVTEVLDLIKYNQKLRADVVQFREWKDEFFILGYKDKLKQAFLNIVINAYQAMEKSESPKLTVQMQSEGGIVTVRIGDSGSGMPEETRKRIFEPFYTTKSQGTGLGLAVTHKIFEGHEASIMVESEPGRGTEFVIKIKEAAKLN